MKICMALTLLMLPISLSALAAEPFFVEKEIVSYPFVASPQRAAAIARHFQRVNVGMAPSDVKTILGEPDEVRPLYRAIFNSDKKIGHTYWYVIRRATPNGSVDEKQEAVVRISFDLEARVTAIHHWGFDDAGRQLP